MTSGAKTAAGPATAGSHGRAGSAWRVVWIGLVAGSLDIGENLIYNAFRHITPAMVFRYVASGLAGTRHAIAWGAAGVALGVVVHYLIALSWTAVFYVASRRWRLLTRRPVASGLGFGLVVFAVMNFVAVPRSGVPHPLPPMTLAHVLNALAPLLFCIGLTVALLTARFAPPPPPPR